MPVERKEIESVIRKIADKNLNCIQTIDRIKGQAMMTSLKEFGDGLTYKDIIAYADMGGLFSAGKKGILLTEEMIRNSSHQKVLLKDIAALSADPSHDQITISLKDGSSVSFWCKAPYAESTAEILKQIIA
ncbi:MAG TPA: hypothetical protein DHW39_08495 [Erysipelotrichaceae bacterium]|nr:hypothetical protein [Erysipelotrichaceae bacterium]